MYINKKNQMYMKKNSVIRVLSLSLVSSFLLTSCMTDVDLTNVSDNLKIDQSLVLPLGEAGLTLEDILNQLDTIEYIGSEEDQIFVQYSDSLLWDYRDITLGGSNSPIDKTFKPSPSATYPVPPNTEINLQANSVMELGINSNPDDQRFDIIKANSATIDFEISKQDIDIQPSDIKIILTFPSSSLEFDNGGSTVEYHPTAFGVASSVAVQKFSIYTVGGATSIPVNIQMIITTGSAPVTVSPSSSLNVKVSLANIDFKVGYGHFEPSVTGATEEKDVDLGELSDMLPKGLFKLSDPSIKFTVSNNIGVKLGLNIEHVKAYRKNEPAYEPIWAKFKNDSHATLKVVDAAPEYGRIAESEFTLDKDSGKIDQLFDNPVLPNMLNYKFRVTNIGEERVDFITPHARINVKFDVKVPLKLKAGSYYEMSDTIPDMAFDSLLNGDYIDHAILVLKVTNGLPVGADFKLRLLDGSENEIVTSIVTDYVINPAPVDANGLVLKDQLVSQTLQIQISKSQLADLRLTKSLAFDLKVSGVDGKPINFEPSNSFKIKAGIFVKADYALPTDNDN